MSGEGVIPNRVSITRRFKRGTICCPQCNSDALIRDSDQETELTKALWIMCGNVDCGMTWKAQISFVYVLSPSAIPRADLVLPKAPEGYQRRVYAAGPATAGPDPNQFSMFDEGAHHAAAAA